MVVGGSMQIVQAPVRERMETKARRHVKAASAEVKTLVMSAMVKVRDRVQIEVGANLGIVWACAPSRRAFSGCGCGRVLQAAAPFPAAGVGVCSKLPRLFRLRVWACGPSCRTLSGCGGKASTPRSAERWDSSKKRGANLHEGLGWAPGAAPGAAARLPL